MQCLWSCLPAKVRDTSGYYFFDMTLLAREVWKMRCRVCDGSPSLIGLQLKLQHCQSSTREHTENRTYWLEVVGTVIL